MFTKLWFDNSKNEMWHFTYTEPKPYLLISLLFFFLQAQIYLKNNKKQNKTKIIQFLLIYASRGGRYGI